MKLRYTFLSPTISLILLLLISSIFPLQAQITDEDILKSQPVPIPKYVPSEQFVAHSNIVRYDVATGQETIIEIPTMPASKKEGEYRLGNKGFAPEKESSEEDLLRVFTDLQIINNPEDYPWRSNVKIFIPGPNFPFGSGLLIDSKHVLTAAHVVYNDSSHTYNVIGDIVPGYQWNGMEHVKPYGEANMVSCYVFTEYMAGGGLDWDIAVIELDRPIGAITGWFGYGYNPNDDFFLNNTFHHAGYPAAPPYSSVKLAYWYGYFDFLDPGNNNSPHRIYHNKVIGEGMSGSGFYALQEVDTRIAYGVYSHYSEPFNTTGPWSGYTRITGPKFNAFVNEIDDNTPNMYDFIPLWVQTEIQTINEGEQLTDLNFLAHNYSSDSYTGNISWGVYMSTDKVITSSDVLLGTYNFNIDIAPKQSFNLFHDPSPQIPDGTPTGTYYIGIIMNTNDFNPQNNITSMRDLAEINVLGPTVVYPTWQYTVTGENHTIILPATLTGSFGITSLEPNDFIGLFYKNGASLECAGFGQWMGPGTTSSFPVFGDDTGTPGKNGFNAGEIFNIIVWKACCGYTIEVEGTYQPPGGLITHTNSYANDGVSALAELSPKAHNIHLVQGWNMISSYRIPFLPDMFDVLNPIWNDVALIKNGAGVASFPSLGINPIGNWNYLEGYQIRVNQDVVLPIVGEKVIPQNHPIPISVGWQIIPYLRDSPANAVMVLAPISTKVDIVKDNDGHTYVPAYGANTIGDLKPGQGYKLKAHTATTLVYPNFTGTDPNSLTSEPAGVTSTADPVHFTDFNIRTGNDATLVIPKEVVALYLQPGDEIGVFGNDGQLCGAGVYEDFNFAITIWGDDSSTPTFKEGLSSGEIYSLRLWSSDEDKEYQIEFALEEGTHVYTTDGLMILSDFELASPVGVSFTKYLKDFRYFPSPAKEKLYFNLVLEEKTDVRMDLYTIAGDYLAGIREGAFAEGDHSFEYDVSGIPNGLYMIQVLVGEETQVFKVVVCGNN